MGKNRPAKLELTEDELHFMYMCVRYMIDGTPISMHACNMRALLRKIRKAGRRRK